jgi:hypothetical protein
MSLDGVLDKLNSRNVTDAGPLDLINHDDDDPDVVRCNLFAALALSRASLKCELTASLFLRCCPAGAVAAHSSRRSGCAGRLARGGRPTKEEASGM